MKRDHAALLERERERERERACEWKLKKRECIIVTTLERVIESV